MAKLTTSVIAGGLSGRSGNAVFAQTRHGVVLRSRPDAPRRTSPRAPEISRALKLAHAAWRGLSEADFQAWQLYAMREDRPAVQLFVGLATKFLQLHPEGEVPSRPPTGAFLGDAVQFSVLGGAGSLTVTALSPNAAGVVTEILVQKLTGLRNATRPKSYRSEAFVAFAAAGQSAVLPLMPGAYAVAIRFVNAATGQASALVEIGRGMVSRG